MPPALSRGFSCERLTFQPDTENIHSSVYVAIVRRTTVGTNPVSYSKRAPTFRTTGGNTPAARARLGSQTLIDDFNRSPLRNRFVLEHRPQRRPTRIRDGLRHLGLAEFGWADIANDNPVIVSNYAGRDDMQEMLSLVGNLRCQRAGALLQAESLEPRQLFFRLTIKSGHFDFIPVTQSGERLQSKINPNCHVTDALSRIGNFDGDIDVPAPTRVSGEAPRFLLATFGQGAGMPQVVTPLHKGQNATTEFGCSLECCDRYPIKIAFEGSEARCARERHLSGVYELLTDSRYAIGVQPKFATNARAKLYQVKTGRALDGSSSLPSRMRFSVDLTAIVPNEINRARLGAESPPCRGRTVFEAVTIGQEHPKDLCLIRLTCKMAAALGSRICLT